MLWEIGKEISILGQSLLKVKSDVYGGKDTDSITRSGQLHIKQTETAWT